MYCPLGTSGYNLSSNHHGYNLRYLRQLPQLRGVRG